MSDDNSENEEEEKNIQDYIHFFFKKKIDLEIFEYEFKIDEEGVENTFGGGIPLGGGFKAKLKESERTSQRGLEFGGSQAKGGLFFIYDKRKKQPGLKAEMSALNMVGADITAKYNYEEDIIDIKSQMNFSAFGFGGKFDLFHTEIKDVAHNTIGKALDASGNAISNFINHVSPKLRELADFNKDLSKQANNVKNIGDLNDVIRKVGDYEMAKNNISVSYQIHNAEFNYLKNLDNSINTNTHNIEINRQRLDVHENILGEHTKILNVQSQVLANHENKLNIHEQILSEHTHILANHEKRINQHERIINIHTAILMNHDKRLNQHERILNSHENRLNQHESILNIHSSILSKHEETLNIHENAINNLYEIANRHGELINLQGKKLIELDSRMLNVENDLNVLNKQVNIHSEILSQHNEILNNQGECIQELYNIKNNQQIQLNMHNELINEHQNAIIHLYSNFHGLKERVENDEKAIKDLGNNISKVIEFSVDTDNIINGLIDQNQINQDLIVQNNNDIIEIKKELKNHANFILMHHQHLQDISKSLELQWKIINIQDKEINEIKQFAQNLSNEIENIYNQIDELKNKLSDIEKNFDTLSIAKKIKKIKNDKEYIKERINELIDNVNDFDEQQKSDFIKCMFMAINNGTYNLEHLEKVAENITNNI